MSKSIFVPLSQMNFPSTCVVCLSSASSNYPIQQVYSYGNKTHAITVDVPMCNTHFDAASHKGFAERAIGCLGVAGGVLIGILSVVVLLLRWEGGGGIL
ncbi:MAG TPA: hypothetical protein VJ785_16350, partial [Anaerolineales bacterium]|nr:hypothetical protein [Anaerolineales bacterium]